MSRIATVLKNKNSIERKEKQRKREEITNIKVEAAYRAKLHEAMNSVSIILGDDNVKNVIIEVPKTHVTKFSRAIFGEEMSEYSIIQVDESHFQIGRKMLNF